ncbi:hypothetical protein RE428_15180 [Marinobacter nanhaiticus D15-8W]|uniref:Uncharacterized protein n=1 Tax=Marinobacter nanhaiticus D15-8W TaxID=626887 RepID=N6WQ11_9GAMM|nr:hypothetical protein [Marinobacter nanhaiticus]ENO13142.1 hypothetical protein J057_17130 [Marinobacter nanhaiticus D15-8W]BES70500.1 hypothetical protein RE428_15180 [Marinobacter nanhaiticus D15-8W]
MTQNQPLPQINVVGRCLFAFAVASLITAFILSLPGGTQKLAESVPADGGIVGPFHIEEDDTILRANVRQNLPVNQWSFVTLSLLDSQKRYLTGFGEGFWDEDGYDEGYYWREAEESYEAKVTVAKPGDYYLQVTPESNLSPNQISSSPINVQVATLGFSPIPHMAIGILALIAYFVLRFFRKSGSTLDLLREH